MKFSLAATLVVVLAADVAVASNWFSKAGKGACPTFCSTVAELLPSHSIQQMA